MKYKMLGLSALAAALCAVLLIGLVLPEGRERYIEHQSAAEKAPCDGHPDGSLCTHLPLVMLSTGGERIPGEPICDENGVLLSYTLTESGATTTAVEVKTVENEDRYNHPTDPEALCASGLIRVRGHSSRRFDKHNYLLQFKNADGTNRPTEFLGMDAHHEWALHGPFLDKTLIRNYMWYHLAGLTMEYSPNVRFCEVMLNGEYQGLYLATEVITAGEEGARLGLKVNKKQSSFTGYALRLDWGDSVSDKKLYPYTHYTLRANTQHEFVYPGLSNLTPELREAIKNDFSSFEKTLYSYDFNDKDHGYRSLLDVDSFVDYFLINEISCNYDAGSLSTYIYKDADGKFKLCVWDFNSALDAYQEGAMPSDEFRLQHALWFERLFLDPDFTERVIERYGELRRGHFSNEALFSFIDDSIAYLGEAVERNEAVWGYAYAPEHDLMTPSERNPRSYGEAVAQMKDFLQRRLAFMDENIESLRQFSANSKTKQYNELAD